MALDEKKRFAQQAELLKRPSVDLSSLSVAVQAGNVSVIDSFNLLGSPEEISVALRSGDETAILRLNPEVAYHFARDVLLLGKRLGWWEMDFSQNAPTQNS